MSDQNHATFLTKDALSHAEKFRLQIMRGAWMPLKKSGVQWRLRLLALMALTTIGGCDQIEFYRLQGKLRICATNWNTRSNGSSKPLNWRIPTRNNQ